MFIAALFRTAAQWKHLNCPSTDEWIKVCVCVCVCVCVTECYLAVRKKCCQLWQHGWIQRVLYYFTTWNKSDRERQILDDLNSACVLSCFRHVQLFAIPWTAALQAPLSMGILQARILEWVAMPSSRESSQPRDRTCISCVSCTGWQVLYH